MPGVPVQLVTRRAIIARLCLIDGPLECPRGGRRGRPEPQKSHVFGPITRRDEHLVHVNFSKNAVTNQSEREASHRSQSRARSGKAFAYYCNDLSARVLISPILTKIGSVAFTGTVLKLRRLTTDLNS